MSNFSKNFFAQCSVEGRVFEKFQKKIFSKSQKCPQSFPKLSKRVLNVFWGKLFEKFFAQSSMEGRVFENFQNNQKICKIPKVPKIVLKSIQTCFELALGQIFRKIFLPSVPWRVEFSKIFKKNIFKIPKCPKSFPKVSKHVLNLFWVEFCENFFAQCSVEGRVFENFQKKIFSKFQNAQNRSQKFPNMF